MPSISENYYILIMIKNIQSLEFPFWYSGNESEWYPWGCGFNPWPCSVGQRSGIVVSCDVLFRQGSDPTLLWLGYRLAAVPLIWPLAWQFPYAVDVALKRKKKKIQISNKTKSLKDTSTHMFIIILLKIAKTCQQSKYSMTDEWIKKMLYIHIYNEIPLGHKKKMWFAAALM